MVSPVPGVTAIIMVAYDCFMVVTHPGFVVDHVPAVMVPRAVMFSGVRMAPIPVVPRPINTAICAILHAMETVRLASRDDPVALGSFLCRPDPALLAI